MLYCTPLPVGLIGTLVDAGAVPPDPDGLARLVHQLGDANVLAVVESMNGARFVHDRLADTVYGGVSRALRRTAEGAGRAAASNTREGAPLHSTPAVAFALAVLNGFYGDRLTAARSDLAIELAIRDPLATRTNPRLAVFVHGLGETDEAWHGLPPNRARATYGERLREDLGFTTRHVRYNTGLHISENGRLLAKLLDQLASLWPTEIHEIAVIGHSMGGLVGRSACHYSDGCVWCSKVRHVFTLGSPHLGAPLEQAANAASREHPCRVIVLARGARPGQVLEVRVEALEPRSRGRRGVVTWRRRIVNQAGVVVQEGRTKTLVRLALIHI